MKTKNTPNKILMYEVNEITWELMEPFLKKGRLPHFQKLLDQGAVGKTTADEPVDLREPWVTWTTLFTGVPHNVHKLVFLEQPPESLGAIRIWDHLHAAGKKVGVFGSAGTWPPKKVNGFFIPGSFSPDSQTFPSRLQPIQDLNLTYTRAHAPGTKQPSLVSNLKRALKLFSLGLNPATLFSLLPVLISIKLDAKKDWKKVSLQPIVNFAFFKKLVSDLKPDFATFHTNHVAHYQHRFFRAWKPELFPDKTDAEEVSRFSDSIGFGYEVADQILGQFMELCERENMILCVASSLGQQAFIPARHQDVAPPTCRVKSIENLVKLLGLEGHCDFFSTMAPQWNLRIADEAIRAKAIVDITSACYMPLNKSMYSIKEVENTLVLTPLSRHGLDEKTTCHFPTLVGSPTYPFKEMVRQEDDTRKSGCHHPIGLLAFYGKQIQKLDFGEVNNLDVTPTLLSLMGLQPPSYMPGRILANEILISKMELQELTALESPSLKSQKQVQNA